MNFLVRSLTLLARPFRHVFGGLLRNARAGFALAVLRPRMPGDFRATGRQLFLLYLAVLAVGFFYDLYVYGWQGGAWDAYALPVVSFWAPAALFSAWIAAGIAKREDLFLPLATAGFALVCGETIATYLLAVAADLSPALDRVYAPLSWLPLVWLSFAYGVGAARMTQTGLFRRIAIFLVSALLFLLPQWAVNPDERIWNGVVAADEDEPTGPDSPQAEQTLYGQADMLEDALDAVAPAQQGVTELFTISFGGDGSQDVFLNEANGADSIMADAFDSSTRSIVLANSKARPQERPFATVSALQRALATVADRMNGDEDILALFLTSHGTPAHELVVSLSPYEFEQITPDRLRGLLDDSGIRYRIVIVSSCYSGGFVEALSSPDTMVITASSADRTSFGCRDGAQWTDFGRAYFDEALAQTGSFEGAFRIASRHIAERESKENLTPSQPQIFVGASIRDQLQRLETRRGGRILFASRDR